MPDFLTIAARRVPARIRKIILQERFIDKAVNLQEQNSPMEYLFDVYEEFLDPAGEFDDFGCHKCRGHILEQWRRLKPHLENLQLQER
ncbi:hypothetical protein [Deminuibacter soli]|uniref:Uncharacterized protein n=1 Tax=Deminuibacter soli TaxID=2291815 RepID=A0A3E1NQ33_9BACT|nr:hypothetical protein [Deminuibacter soli]RFM30033.1 hypothetical protein DXN05_03415 [Deminuibacter soli]